MKIINKTQYDTRLLRSVICATYNRVKKTEGPLCFWRQLKIKITSGRRRKRKHIAGGRARIDGPLMWLFLPIDHCDTADFAWTVEHELLHNYGYGHRKMPRIDWETYRQNYKWAVDQYGEFIFPKAPKEKPIVDLQMKRYERLCQREKTWISKESLAKKALAKIRKSKRYYEKQLAAKNKT